MNQSFVIIMSVSGKHIHVNFCFENAIDQAMFLGYLSAPSVFRSTFLWFRMACACLGMLHKFVQQLDRFLEAGRFTSLQLSKAASASGEKVILYIIIKH